MNPITMLVNQAFVPFLKYSYDHILPNYGVSIILLTALLKLIFWPLTQKQFSSMRMTQKLQPQVKKLQEKYKKEPEKLQKEMMKLWKDNGTNPFAGCLPALIQIPFFIAIFYTIKSPSFLALLSAPGVNKGLFPFFLSDLSVVDHTYIMPVFIGLLSYWTQKMMGPSDPTMPNFLMFMPVIMFIFCLKMPAGVLIYWAVNQAISVGQQYLVGKNFRSRAVQVIEKD